MIRINLLPSELRKGQRSVNPHVLGIGASAAAALFMAGLWAWVHWSSLPGAGAAVDAYKVTLDEKTKAAAEVEELEKVIAVIKDQRDSVLALIDRKVLWAKTLDDLADLVASGFNANNGFSVRISELSISPLAAAAAARGPAAARDKSEKVEFSLKLRFKLIGAQLNQSGNYIENFFTTVERSAWWRENGFIRRVEDKYKGDDPQWKDKIQRVTIEMPLEFTRQKLVGLAVAKPGKAR